MLRQSLFGGDLATNLLELGSLDEQALLSATAATLEVPALASGRIVTVAPELIRLFPANQLLEHPFLPLTSSDSELVVAAASPLTAATLDELRGRIDKPVVIRAALEVRILQALATQLGLDLDERTTKLLARLDGVAAVTPAVAADTPPPSSGVPTPRISVPSAAIRSLLPKRREPKQHGQARRLGPFTAAMAEIELASAQTPGDVIAIWLDFAAQYFDYTAIFAVQGDLAAGKAARGSGTVGEAFARIGVPLDLPSALQRSRAAATWQLTALEPRGLDRTLARDLGRNAGHQVLLLPISIKQRVVLLTYGDHGEDDVLLARVGDVLALQPLVERHLERMLVERKRGGRSLQPTATRSAPAPERKYPSIPQATDRANALAEALAPSATQPSAEPPQAPIETLPSQPSVGAPIDPHEGRTVPAPPAAAEDDGGSGPALGAPRAVVSIDTEAIDDSWDIIQPVLAVGDGDSARLTRAATNNPSTHARDSSPPGSVWPGASTRPGIVAPKLELIAESEGAADASPRRPGEITPMLPYARVDTEAAREVVRPLTSPSSHPPPRAVEYRQSCLELLDRFVHGDATALGELIEQGDAAVGVLVAELPGPLSTPSRIPRMDQAPKASDCGPVLKALVAFGPVARPYVIARTSDGDPKVRVWSTRLLGELTGRQSAIAVAQRIVLDRDAEVRRAAYLASSQLLREPDSAQALRQALLSTASDHQSVITQRLAAIDALADLRDAPSIPNLIELLADPNPGTAAAAQQALTVLARQDFGYDAKTWTTWWNNNLSRDRIEWVIDALDHRSPAIRQAASEELRLISRLYVGNVDDDSVEARAKVQKKYRDWWATGVGSPSGRPARQ